METNCLKDGISHSKTLRRQYLITTVVIYMGNFAYGSSLSCFSPTMSYFISKYGTDNGSMAISTTISAISYLIGASLPSFLYNYMKRQLGVAIGLLMLGIAMILIVYTTALMQYLVIGGVMGLFVGAFDASQIVWVMEMWQSKSGPFLQAQNFFTAIGAILPGLLLPSIFNEIDNTGVDNMWLLFNGLGAFALVAGAAQLFLYFYAPYAPPAQEDIEVLETKETVPETDGEKSELEQLAQVWPKYLRLKVVTLSAIFSAFDIGMEASTVIYISMFAEYSAHDQTLGQASMVYTTLMIAYTVGRASGVYVILKIPPPFILTFNFFVLIVANTLLMITNLGVWTLWLGTAMIGVGYSTIQASFFAYIGRHLTVTNAMGSLFQVCGTAMAAAFPLIIGMQIYTSPLILPVVNLMSLVIIAVTFVFIFLITYKKNPGKL